MGVTIYDVAKHAGVSPRTVSNVVNDHPWVSDGMRVRVRRSIELLGYRPNAVARNLRRGTTGMIAVAVPELGVPYFSELCGTIMDEVGQRGYTVIVEQTNGDPEQERKLLADRKASRIFDGLLFSPLALGTAEIAKTAEGSPVVLLGERVHDGPFDHVSVDNIAAARDAVRHLVDMGRRRIAAIGDQPYETGETAQLRTEGYRRALREAGLKAAVNLVVPTTNFHRTTGFEAMNALLRRSKPPDAVFCFNDLLAIGALRACRLAGVQVPDDVALIGFDDIEEARFCTPTLSTVAPDKRTIAALAIEQLFKRIGGETGEPVALEAPYTLVRRESTLGR